MGKGHHRFLSSIHFLLVSHLCSKNTCISCGGRLSYVWLCGYMWQSLIAFKFPLGSVFFSTQRRYFSVYHEYIFLIPTSNSSMRAYCSPQWSQGLHCSGFCISEQPPCALYTSVWCPDSLPWDICVLPGCNSFFLRATHLPSFWSEFGI